MDLIQAYYTPNLDNIPNSELNEPENISGPCKIHYYNGFDYLVSLDDSDIELIAQDYELSINGVPLVQLIAEGLVKLPEMEDSMQIILR